MKIRAYMRTRFSTVYIRISDRDGVDYKVATDIRIDPTLFDVNIPGYIDSPNVPTEVRETTNAQLKELLEIVKEEYVEGCDKIWLAEVIQKYFHPEKAVKKRGRKPKALTEFFDIFDDYIKKEKSNPESAKPIVSVGRRLRRYEAWRQQMEGQEDFKLRLEDFGRDMLEDFLHYHYNEYEYFCNYPNFFKQFTLFRRTIVPSSKNSLSSCCGRLKAFLNWTVRNGYNTDTTFREVPAEPRIYGTPYYLSIEERDQLYAFDLSYVPQAELARDVFVFNCLVGCRQGDLFRLTRDNIKDGWLEYIPNKNLAFNRTEYVRVPLADKALAILAKYEGLGNRLFPHLDLHTYGTFIKFSLQVAGINRVVTILNPLTRQEEQHPLYEVATTHTARKTFIGNLYKQVKDQALVASLTGHSPNSVAFQRYRTIDDDIKREVLQKIQ